MATDSPKILLDIDQGYEPVTDAFLEVGERELVLAVIRAGLGVSDAAGIRRDFLIPPAIALKVVRAVATEWYRQAGDRQGGLHRLSDQDPKNYAPDENAGIPTAKG